jgi:lipopolysaccharide transport system ATP-binding protein
VSIVAAPAIRLIGVGKQYRRGLRREGYRTLRETVTDGARGLAAAAVGRRRPRDAAALFWALRDVTLEVPRGSALGLIGPNGAGKSTLLKILSRVTEPTAGQVQLYGRVGSLLEVGTGFHPELTGRENVLLNGAILGMTRAETLAKFDAIVSFAEVEPFIDTPVKHYSSGMYLRLAFAVAAHLEPEILLVDEVLAVGDAAFQKRCLGKMNDVAREGRTVVFVSHNLEAIERLCSHAVMLEKGPSPPSARHRRSSRTISPPTTSGRRRARASTSPACRAPGPARRGSWPSLYGTGQAGGGKPWTNGPLEFELAIQSDAPRQVRSLAVFLTEQYGTKVINADTLHIDRTIALREGLNRLRLRLPSVPLTPGFYRVGLWVADPVQAQSVSGAYDYLESAFEIEVTRPESSAALGTGALVACDFDVEEIP